MSRSRRRAAAPEEQARSDVDTLLGRLGTTIDPELLVLALTHRSFAHEAGGLPTNERLEFLGDSVLGVVVTERLYRDHPDVSEGDLAKMRAATVSQRALASVARTLGLGEFVLLGRGELVTGGREKDSILSDTVEALIGATYLCHGLEHTRGIVEHLVAALLRDADRRGAGLDAKTALQELSAGRGTGVPHYEVEGEGPDHARFFRARAVIDDAVVGEGEGTSKKTAEQASAEDALERLAELADAAQDALGDAAADAGAARDDAIERSDGADAAGRA